jgi:peptidoglycan/LPS O-acetylase OafA/YrhL
MGPTPNPNWIFSFDFNFHPSPPNLHFPQNQTAMQSDPKTTNATGHLQIPALDGLRAVAVLGVLLFHIYPPALPGGFTGVDVFFVLSGFLITSIILHDIQTGAFSFKEFYLRRIQRLLPNATVTIAATVLLLAFFLPAGLEIFTARHGVWALFNLSNIYTWLHHGSYWDTNAEWAFLT